MEQADEFKGAMYAAIIKIEKPTEFSTDYVSTVIATPRRTSMTATINQVRLPKITFWLFSSDTIQWIAFWDSFDPAIHDND